MVGAQIDFCLVWWEFYIAIGKNPPWAREMTSLVERPYHDSLIGQSNRHIAGELSTPSPNIPSVYQIYRDEIEARARDPIFDGQCLASPSSDQPKSRTKAIRMWALMPTREGSLTRDQDFQSMTWTSLGRVSSSSPHILWIRYSPRRVL